MRILGLDISTKTGFAVIEDNRLIEYGLLKVPVLGEDGLSLVKTAFSLSSEILKVTSRIMPDLIIIEQTNPGRFRVQKLLEFLHMATIIDMNKSGFYSKVQYMDTSRWRQLISLRLSSDQRKHNKKVKQRAARGKITSKHLSVKWANEKFSMNFKLKDNDICDAICLAFAASIYKKENKEAPSLSAEDVLLLK